MKYTEEQLKRALVKALSEQISYEDTNVPRFWWKHGVIISGCLL